MSERKQPKNPKKERVKSVPMDASILEEIKTSLRGANVLIDTLENPKFVQSIHINTDMAIKKVYQRLGIAKKTELLKAIREGKDVQIVG